MARTFPIRLLVMVLVRSDASTAPSARELVEGAEIDTGIDALRIVRLSKKFGHVPAVAGLDLTVRRGELYALLGPNGAGKTTTLRITVGLLKPDQGLVTVCGIDALADPLAAKRLVSWVPDEPMLYDKLTPREYLAFVSGLWELDAGLACRRADELLSWLELGPVANERCEGFSRGMRQKVALAGALIYDPSLLILDEPLTGLDAASARQVKDVLRERVRAGGTVILTTHILEVAERLSDRIGIIHSGRLIAEGTFDELRERAGMPGSTLEAVFLDLVSDARSTA
jgi:ABC-2 type transport system ATP-binding protein